MTPLFDIESVVRELGGPAAVGRLTGNVGQAAWNWKSKGKLPPKYYFVIREALDERGFIPVMSLFKFVEPAMLRKLVLPKKTTRSRRPRRRKA
jgi:hypothetical protein